MPDVADADSAEAVPARSLRHAFIKMLGVGMIVALVLDATPVRMVLVRR